MMLRRAARPCAAGKARKAQGSRSSAQRSCALRNLPRSACRGSAPPGVAHRQDRGCGHREQRGSRRRSSQQQDNSQSNDAGPPGTALASAGWRRSTAGSAGAGLQHMSHTIVRRAALPTDEERLIANLTAERREGGARALGLSQAARGDYKYQPTHPRSPATQPALPQPPSLLAPHMPEPPRPAPPPRLRLQRSCRTPCVRPPPPPPQRCSFLTAP